MPSKNYFLGIVVSVLTCVAVARGQTITIAATPNPSVFGQPVTLTASVPSTFTGKVTFYDGTSVVGTATVATARAFVVTRFLAPGTRSLRAYYLGDNSNSPAVSSSISQVVTASSTNGLQGVLNYATGAGPVSVTVGDFNNDGKVDLATANLTAGTVSVLRGNGDGTYQAASSITLDRVPRAILTADVDGNGTQDLVVAGAGGVSVLPGNGDGTFQTPKGASTGGDPIGIVAADFNGDGRVDVAVITQNDSAVYVLLGNGDGTFGGPLRYPLAAAGQSIALGDFNQDGRPDVVVGVSNGTLNQVGVLFANADGTLQTPNYVTTSGAPGSLTVADFNGDGKLDVAFVSGTTAIGVMLGATGGALLAPSAVTATSPIAVVAVDFNSDGRPDLAYASGTASTVSLALGNGDGTFRAATPYNTGGVPAGIAVGELNGDGKLDVIVPQSSSVASQVGVLLGVSAGLSIAVDNSAGLVRGGNSSFNITVSNSAGSNPTTGAVTLAITIPSSLTLVSATGTGWLCTGASCLRTDQLNAGASYQTISVTLGVPLNAPPTATVTSVLTGGGSAGVSVSTAFSIPPLGPSPVSPANGANGVLLGPTLTWTSSLGSASYDIYMGTSSPPPFVWNTTDLTYTAAALSPCTTYYWQIAGRSSGGTAASAILSFTTGPSVSVFPAGAIFTQTGGPGSFQVFTASACPWAAVPTDSWITVSSAPTGAGSGTVNYSVAPNPSAQRMGGVVVAGVTFPILQSAGCVVSFNPSATVDASGQNLTIGVTGAACSWQAVSNADWITVTSPGTQSGNGIVNLTLAANGTNSARVGTVTIGNSPYTVTQRQTVTTFADVVPSNSFFDAINLLYAKSITSGCLANPLSYCPNDNVTRGQMAVFIVRAAMGNDNFTYSQAPYFNDVGPSNGFYKWIQKMRDLGITTGCGTNYFCPNDPVTRGQMAVFVIRARYGSDTVFSYTSTPLFTDVAASDPFFQWIQKMDQVGITAGCSSTQYCPDSLVTRGQMAVFVMRGAFNQLLPAGAPLIASVSPASLSPGSNGVVTLTGVNTNFIAGATQITAVDGIIPTNVTVTSATSLTVTFNVGAAAALGPRTVIVTTGAEEAVSPNGFVVH